MYTSDEVPGYEPDLMVILTENMDRLQAQRVNGPADTAIEIVSPGSSSTDHGEKFIEYEAAGVREYWFIDPIRKLADVYILGAKNCRKAARLSASWKHCERTHDST